MLREVHTPWTGCHRPCFVAAKLEVCGITPPSPRLFSPAQLRLRRCHCSIWAASVTASALVGLTFNRTFAKCKVFFVNVMSFCYPISKTIRKIYKTICLWPMMLIYHDLSIHPFIHLPIHLSIYLSIYPSIHPSIHSSIYLFSIFLAFFIVCHSWIVLEKPWETNILNINISFHLYIKNILRPGLTTSPLAQLPLTLAPPMARPPRSAKQLPGDSLAIQVRGTGSVGPCVAAHGGIHGWLEWTMPR